MKKIKMLDTIAETWEDIEETPEYWADSDLRYWVESAILGCKGAKVHVKIWKIVE